MKNLMDEFLNESKKQKARIINSRTVESVTFQLLEKIADAKLISGDQDLGQALIQLSRAQLQDPVFAEALNTIATKALELFPNQPLEEKEPATV